MEYAYVKQMTSTYGVTGYPTAFVNRAFKWNEQVTQLNTELNIPAELGLAINTTKSGNMVNVRVRVGFVSDIIEPIKLVVCVTENELYYSQRNYYNDVVSSPWY